VRLDGGAGDVPRVKKVPADLPRLPDRPGRWKLLLRRQRRRLRPGLLLLLIAIGLLVGGAVLHSVSAGASFNERIGHFTAGLGLRVRSVLVEGRQKTPEPLLRAAIGVAPGDPILVYSLRAARARIETINWVQKATVERRLPGTILVSLIERHPFAIWQNQGKFSLIDRDGQLVTDSDVASFAGQLPLVVGAGAPAAAAPLIDLLAARPALQSRVTALVRIGGRRWNLQLKNGIEVMLPEGAEAQALARLDSLQTDHALLDRPLQAIDMRLPDRLVLRPQPDHEPEASDGPHGGTPSQPPPRHT
jgi:cell division protein FtsQ